MKTLTVSPYNGNIRGVVSHVFGWGVRKHSIDYRLLYIQ